MKAGNRAHNLNEKRKQTLNIQKSEKLRSLLLNKFKSKFKAKPIPDELILQEIDRFMSTKELTINNLRDLDREIMLAINRPKTKPETKEINRSKEMPKPMKQSALKGPLKNTSYGIKQKSLNETKKEKRILEEENNGVQKEEDIANDEEIKKVIENEENKNLEEPIEPNVETKSKQNEKNQIDEEAEWNAFQKFKNKLYEEELRQEVEKKRDNIQFMREQLDRQLFEKEQLKKQKEEEERLYAQSEKTLLDRMNENERIRSEEQKEKSLNIKKDRLDQIMKVKERKANEKEEQQKEDKKVVERIRKEQIQEKEFIQYKKLVQKETLKQMMDDTMKNREKQKAEIAQEKLDDIKAQQHYRDLLDRQDEERAAFFKSKDEMNSKLVNEIAKNVIEKQKERAKFEEDLQEKIEKKKAMKERRADEMRRKIEEQNKLEMREFLAKQLDEKRKFKEEERNEDAEQRKVWLKQQKEAEDFDKKRAQELFEMNKTNQKFLDIQKEEAKSKIKKPSMPEPQYLLNKNLFDEAKKKLVEDYADEDMPQQGPD